MGIYGAAWHAVEISRQYNWQCLALVELVDGCCQVASLGKLDICESRVEIEVHVYYDYVFLGRQVFKLHHQRDVVSCQARLVRISQLCKIDAISQICLFLYQRATS